MSYFFSKDMFEHACLYTHFKTLILLISSYIKLTELQKSLETTQLCHLTDEKLEIKRLLHLVCFWFPDIILLLPNLITNHNNLWLSSSNIIGTIIKTSQVSLSLRKVYLSSFNSYPNGPILKKYLTIKILNQNAWMSPYK